MTPEKIGFLILQHGVPMLYNVITKVMKQTQMFNRQLTQIIGTLDRIKPGLLTIEKLIQELSRGEQEKEKFRDLIEEGEALVRKCGRIKWKVWKKYSYREKLDDYNKKLLEFFQIDVQLLIAETVLDLQLKSEMKTKENCRYSRVPPLKADVIGFDEQVRKLKEMLLRRDSDDCSVVVVSAEKGYGKTTLVTKLCHDSEIKGKFGRNIYFVTISETPNVKLVIKNLIGRDDFINQDDAINQWGSFLYENGYSNNNKILLVLDDVWSDSIINQFKFKVRGYTILATSRIASKQFDTYRLQPLSDQDATALFRRSAFSKCGTKNNDISNDIVDKLVKCCNNNPLVLGVIGDRLKGRREISWVAMLKNLSDHPGLDGFISSNLEGESSINEKDLIKQFISDLGLFPDDQEVSTKMLMDKWVHLSKHDDQQGSGTKHQFFRGCFKKPATRRSTSSGSLLADEAPFGGGLGLGYAVSKLSDAIINTNARSSKFRNQLDQIQEIVTRNKPYFDEIDTLIEALDRPEHEKEEFIAQLKSAETLVLKCGRTKFNVYKRYTRGLKLDKLTESLRRFCERDAPWVVGKGILDLLVARDLQKKT